MKTLLIKFSHYIRKLNFFTAIVLFFKVEIVKVSQLNFDGQKYFLRKGTSDHIVFFQVIVYESYEMAKRWKNVSFIVDAGANIGLSACYFSKQFGKAKIVSIEPEPENFKQLLKNTSALGNVTPLQKALWKNNDELNIDLGSNESWSVKVNDNLEHHLNKANLRVKAISIDTLMNEFGVDRIDILKIDIEGAEFELFSENYELWLPKTRYIMIELHDGFKKGCSTNVMKALAKFSFSIQLTRKENIVFINNNLN